MKSAVLEFQNVSKSYGDLRILDEISFSIPLGQHTAILGASGCGKSTLLRLMAGLISPDSGVILFNKTVFSKPGVVIQPPHLRGIGFVFQDLALWPNLTVLGNVLLALSSKQIGKAEKKARAIKALESCGIASLASRPPSNISGGQQQRLALARAIVLEPQFLILDEAFSGLDLVTRNSVIEQILFIVEQRNITLILATHDPFETKSMCKNVILLDQAKLIESGPLQDLLVSGQSKLIARFRDVLKRSY